MTADQDPLLVVIAGPTAVGKTECSIRVAEILRTEIISGDSRQFYQEMNIGVARPSENQLSRVPHHFIGHRSVRDSYNVSLFEKEALAVLEILFRKHDVVVMTGGSGMYLDAVCRGFDELPDADPSIRKTLRDGYEKYGLQYLRNRLLDLDPDYYTNADISNPQRMIRALEVCMLTGSPYSALRSNPEKTRPFRIRWVGLNLPREELGKRISLRTDAMIREGLEQEARDLYPLRHLNALQTVGYRELFDFFEGTVTFDQAVEKIKTNTRRYAKRQLTWFSRNPAITWLDPSTPTETIISCILYQFIS